MRTELSSQGRTKFVDGFVGNSFETSVNYDRESSLCKRCGLGYICVFSLSCDIGFVSHLRNRYLDVVSKKKADLTFNLILYLLFPRCLFLRQSVCCRRLWPSFEKVSLSRNESACTHAHLSGIYSNACKHSASK